MKLKSLKSEMKDGLAYVYTSYDMPSVSGKLDMTYIVNGDGAVKVSESFTADKSAKVSDMFRFGMQMQMPLSFNHIQYYGRGQLRTIRTATTLPTSAFTIRPWLTSSSLTSVRKRQAQKPTSAIGNS